MSDKCDSCDCADVSQCVRKEGQYDIVIVEKSSYIETIVMMEEHDGKCKCGSSCACVNCTCGH